MELNEFSWERQSSLSAGVALSADDIEAMVRLMSELRELTQSRRSYVAASDFLKRFGREPDADALVQPGAIAN